MIISASYKTDIPTFYGEWFINRLRVGYCKMVNPYGGQIYTIDLSPENVDGFVFWTKNIGPFLKHLPEVRQRGYPFIVQHTITGYPRELESRVINYAQTCEYMRNLAGIYGPSVAIWRYDPIVISDLTTLDWHKRNFEMLTKSLNGTTDEVVVSFAQIYKKTRRNMDLAAKEIGFGWSEHQIMLPESIRKLVGELAQIAESADMHLRICSQKDFLIPGVVEEARCVDADRLERVSGRPILGKTKQKGNRKECACFASRDIGEYDTCPHGCVYCYAVQHRDLALARYKEHDPAGEFLFPPKNNPSNEAVESDTTQMIPVSQVSKKNGQPTLEDKKSNQPSLFDDAVPGSH